MNLQKRIERLEQRAAAGRADDPRDGVATVVMVYLTIGGLTPDDPADMIAARFTKQLEVIGL